MNGSTATAPSTSDCLLPSPACGRGAGERAGAGNCDADQKPPAQGTAIHTTSLLHTPALSPNPSPARGRGEQTSASIVLPPLPSRNPRETPDPPGAILQARLRLRATAFAITL
ncbi:hypothetical protein CBM2637_A210077 [Cupriavidus taiwanensis]|nr:hypothetical protein CBM2637_A210077 [Cupriavidus taiwanensis]SPA51197.1 protein of unknown function [Cupriavidus taiwanensis]